MGENKMDLEEPKMKIKRAIEILNPEHQEHYDGLDEVNEACRMGMEALGRQRWIPLTERIPEGECIAFSAYGEMLIGWIDMNDKSDTGYICEDDGLYLYNVTHWMPLPEPPEEGGEGNAAL